MLKDKIMTDRRQFLSIAAISASVAAFFWLQNSRASAATEKFEFALSDDAWRKKLSAAAYRTLRREATEYPGSSPLNNEHRAGAFACAGCELPLFPSSTKFDSGTGWPSFWQPLPNAVRTRVDGALGFSRTEVHCRRCGGHLGHVFDDGPQPTGKRYCMNGVAMTFAARKA